MQRGVGYPVHAVVVETALAGAVVFAVVMDGMARPTKARVITAARTKVVFICISWVWPNDSTKFWHCQMDTTLEGYPS
jgi:hypothetical protein